MTAESAKLGWSHQAAFCEPKIEDKAGINVTANIPKSKGLLEEVQEVTDAEIIHVIEKKICTTYGKSTSKERREQGLTSDMSQD